MNLCSLTLSSLTLSSLKTLSSLDELETLYVRSTTLCNPNLKILDMSHKKTFNYKRKTNPTTLEHFLIVKT